MSTHAVMPHDPPTSRLARLLQVVTWVALCFAIAAGWAVWPHSRIGSVATVALVLFAYAPVMAIELLLLRCVHGQDPTPRPTWGELAAAWWAEVLQAPRVFAWRQPFVWRRWPDTARGEPTAGGARGRAVVFIHGFVCNRAFWHPWMKALRSVGIPYTSVSLEPVFGSIDDTLAHVEEAVVRAERATGLAPVLVCHSMGGLVARAWLARDAANTTRAHRIVTIGTPHRGTWLARFSHLPNGRQMRQGCHWLVQLAAREQAAHAAGAYRSFVCWYSNADNVVFPASTATLPGADNRLVRGTAHVALAFHPKVMRESLAMVASAESSPRDRTAS